MKAKAIQIVPENHLETLQNCGGFYSCPKCPSGKRAGPLVGYAGRYEADGKKKQFVGEVYANFAKAEIYPKVLLYFAELLNREIDRQLGMNNIDVFCGAPIGGYSLADTLGMGAVLRFEADITVIKAEKQVITAKTESSKEESRIIFGRHTIEPGQRVVIIEDICNNFSTTCDLVLNIRQLGGEVVAIVCFLNRSLTVDDVYCPGQIMLKTGQPLDLRNTKISVISLVRLPIKEWTQEDPAVAVDVAQNNVVWDPKKEWGRLTQAMQIP